VLTWWCASWRRYRSVAALVDCGMCVNGPQMNADERECAWVSLSQLHCEIFIAFVFG
jgi:hypothetical protein